MHPAEQNNPIALRDAGAASCSPVLTFDCSRRRLPRSARHHGRSDQPLAYFIASLLPGTSSRLGAFIQTEEEQDGAILPLQLPVVGWLYDRAVTQKPRHRHDEERSATQRSQWPVVPWYRQSYVSLRQCGGFSGLRLAATHNSFNGIGKCPIGNFFDHRRRHQTAAYPGYFSCWRP